MTSAERKVAVIADLAKDHRVPALGRNPEKLARLGEFNNATAQLFDIARLLAVKEATGLSSISELDLLPHAAGTSNRPTAQETSVAD